MQAGVQIVNQSLLFSSFRQEVSKSNFRLKVGYVSANFKSKTTIYMAKDLLRLHNRSRIKLHIYATSPPDSPNFLKVAMKNVDWRKEVNITMTMTMTILCASLFIYSLYKNISFNNSNVY